MPEPVRKIANAKTRQVRREDAAEQGQDREPGRADHRRSLAEPVHDGPAGMSATIWPSPAVATTRAAIAGEAPSWVAEMTTTGAIAPCPTANSAGGTNAAGAMSRRVISAHRALPVIGRVRRSSAVPSGTLGSQGAN